MSDDIVRRAAALVEKQKAWDAWDNPSQPAPPAMVEGEVATLVSDMAAEITRLRAALATARREGMEEAARWHEMRSMELSGKAGLARNFRQLLQQSDFHMESAAAIRAAAEEDRQP